MWGIELNRENGQPIKRQIYMELKELIVSGRLKAKEALPSTRELARYLSVSRSTVVEAYEMLIAEGYIITGQGAATRVAEGLRMEKPVFSTPKKDAFSKQMIDVDFRTGRPDLRLFPKYLWSGMLHQAALELPLEQYGYSGPQGLLGLRNEIAVWLLRSRGLTVCAEDIFITAGATHALHLLADLLCGEGGRVLTEDPCHTGMLQTFLCKGCQVVPVPADGLGLQTQFLANYRDIGAVYVTPSHQFPLGGVLPASRRAELIRYARDNGLYIIEDDYDSEFRYCGEPIAPLYSMDAQRVVYVGTFSKTLFPALRIGYVILPGPLHKRFGALRTHADVQNPPFEQAALAEFLRTRKLDRHIQRMRRIYGKRRQELLESLKDAFGDDWTAYGDAAGLHVAVDFPGGRFDEAFLKKALANGIFVMPAESHCIHKGRHLSKLLLGYGHLEPDEIHRNVLLLRDFLQTEGMS